MRWKSWTLTLWRFTKPMPPIVRWFVRLAYTVPLFTFLLLLWLTPDPEWFVIGAFVGTVMVIVRLAIQSWLRRYSVALVHKRMGKRAP